MKIILITGKPACGKDTQADLLAKKYKATKITTSEILKKFFKNQKKKKIKIDRVVFNLEHQKELFRRGQLIAYRLVEDILIKRLRTAVKKRESLVIAGSPRSLLEARAYIKEFEDTLSPKEYLFIYLSITDTEATKRALLRKRADNLDTKSVIKNRLASFRKEIMPGIRFLKKTGYLLEINAQQSIQKIFKDTTKQIAITDRHSRAISAKR